MQVSSEHLLNVSYILLCYEFEDLRNLRGCKYKAHWWWRGYPDGKSQDGLGKCEGVCRSEMRFEDESVRQRQMYQNWAMVHELDGKGQVLVYRLGDG